jgi:predicted NBD/HSP70 family sugar kinase
VEKRLRSTKQSNRRLVLDFLRSGDPLSISQISEHTRISKPTAHTIVEFFLSAGLARSAGKGLSTDDGGKKPSLFDLNPRFGYVISIHIWPDKMTAAATDLQAVIFHSEDCPIAKETCMEPVIRLAAEAIKRISELEGLRNIPLVGVAIGLAGIVDAEKGISVSSPHYPNWEINFPFRDELQKLVQIDAPIHVDNVNRYQALAEGEKGLAFGRRNFLIVDALIEGLGAGIITGGKIEPGTHKLAGEIGHMILDPDGYPCICGSRGCFEAMVSVRRLLENVRTGYGQHPDSLIFRGRTPDQVSVGAVFEAFRRGDQFAKWIIDETILWFARGLNNVIMVYDPEMIILQGIYTELGSYFLNELRKLLGTLSLPAIQKDLRIEYSNFGPERGIVGGSLYACQNYFDRDLWKQLSMLDLQFTAKGTGHR